MPDRRAHDSWSYAVTFRIGCYQLLSGEVETMHTERFRASLTVVIGGLVCSPAFAAVGAPAPSSVDPARLANVTIARSLDKASRVAVLSEDVGGAAGVTLPNDACADAAPISGEGIFAFDNSTATMDGPAHDTCTIFEQAQIDHDVWFCWTAPAQACAGSYVVETCGRTVVDTKIAVYSGCACPPTESNLFACRDDDCSVQTRAQFTAVPGQSYLIRMGTFPGESGGSGDFSITCHGGTVCTEPANHCQGANRADALTSNRTSYRVADGFTPTESGTIDSVCWWGTYLTSPPGSIDCQGAAPDAFEIRYFTDGGAAPGTEIASFSQAGGTLAVVGPVPTGIFINPNIVEYEFHATHAGVPAAAGECLWIEITNQLTGCLWLWETGLAGDGRALQDGLPTPPPNGYTADDAVAGDLAFCVNVQIDHAGTTCLPPTPPNDNCADAAVLTGVGAFTVDNWRATTDGPSHPSCLSSDETGIGKDVWYRWRSTCDGTVMLRTCDQTDVDTKVAVYANALCPTAETTPLACNDDICNYQSMVVFNALSGQDYLLRIGSYPRASGGVIRFEMSCGPPNNPACPGGGSCCEAGLPGIGSCSDKACCETVCACDPYCCDVEWDANCALHGLDAAGCGAADLCVCASVCGRPDAGDCCAGNRTPGCNDEACCASVCACDPYCCETEWDNNCAGTGFVPGCGAALLCTAHCTPPPTCPSGAVAFVNPPSGIVDARQPNAPGNPAVLQGFQTFTVTAPAAAATSCWTPCETRIAGTPNAIANVIEAPAGTYTIALSRPISAGAVTTLTYAPSAGAATTGFFTSHPANVNGDSAAAPVDILDLIDHLNGVRVPPLNVWQCDIDRSVLCAPADILTEIDLLNGASGFAVWNGTPRPSATGLCPQP